MKQFLLPLSASLANFGHLLLCKLPHLQACFRGLQAFSTSVQPVDFFDRLKGRRKPAARAFLRRAVNGEG